MKSSHLSERLVEYVLTRKLDELPTLTVESSAKYLKINRSHLSRTFKNEKGFTIEEFIFKVKIIRAASLLKEKEELTIKDVAKKMGFCRCDYFIKIFKHYFGTTPAKYRELMKLNPDE
ncbi:MAG: helix-turn-helix domain-containing protein [Acidobacteria bacterium]|jgi:two-component system response regulator YesN|nr:helix-turn-helix domain-containing protein [Acidobacteriota bacterium]